MIEWIKDKLNLIRFKIRPLKIASYNDSIKERLIPEIQSFYSNMRYLNYDTIEKAIRLIGYMEFDPYHEGFCLFICIKESYQRVQNYGKP